MDLDLPQAAGQFFLLLQADLFARIKAAGFDDVRPRHGAVLAYIGADGRRVSEIAELSGQHKQVVSVVADELEELGYVERRPDPSDGRAKLLVPTARGEAQIRAAREIIRTIEQEIGSAIGGHRLESMKASIADALEVLRTER
ncbi:MarR family winged helix-turn-helix transcriptional regulator [Curtobacterium sp. MCBA15_008]|jgi:DNA-binding MarR family transcriptional regulator|uniref:MarR family winged helix-turn-helix transcriptional regulator n=1 Tax=Curtobacterium sp. MCBA15_008 TaxID=1898736 RepID=UPI0008DD53D3|nr:MarR family transcriptional regulator [Curtobacterium sp. MCBA15_008]OII09064.1 hypothetical protein BIU96_03970 [Curtobacterium sp. MCBA15_008]